MNRLGRLSKRNALRGRGAHARSHPKRKRVVMKSQSVRKQCELITQSDELAAGTS
jgi:hypothetical protein